MAKLLFAKKRGCAQTEYHIDKFLQVRKMGRMTAAMKDIDALDKKIIIELQEDARRPYKDISGKLNVSEGTVRNRVTRLINRGDLNLEARVNPFALPDRISAIVGVNL